jgi:hypothetical protein
VKFDLQIFPALRYYCISLYSIRSGCELRSKCVWMNEPENAQRFYVVEEIITRSNKFKMQSCISCFMIASVELLVPLRVSLSIRDKRDEITLHTYKGVNDRSELPLTLNSNI